MAKLIGPALALASRSTGMWTTRGSGSVADGHEMSAARPGGAIAAMSGLVYKNPSQAINWALSGFSNNLAWLIFASNRAVAHHAAGQAPPGPGLRRGAGRPGPGPGHALEHRPERGHHLPRHLQRAGPLRFASRPHRPQAGRLSHVHPVRGKLRAQQHVPDGVRGQSVTRRAPQPDE